jgi:hypothetical protein
MTLKGLYQLLQIQLSELIADEAGGAIGGILLDPAVCYTIA